jgi:hypothetical protein
LDKLNLSMNKIFIPLMGFCLIISLLPYVQGEYEKQRFEQPLLITSAGQSAEVRLVSVLAKRAELDYILAKLATQSELENVKTLVISLGASLKGLGAAGLDVSQEKERVTSLIEEAQHKKIPLICFHLGGGVRRGQLSDDFITTFLPYAKIAIVVKSGNKDSLFHKICIENQISLIEVDRTIDALKPFQDIFK